MVETLPDKTLAVAAASLPRAQSSLTLTEVAASAAARAFFYPSVLWNIARNRLQTDWAWWNQITEVGWSVSHAPALLVTQLQSASSRWHCVALHASRHGGLAVADWPTVWVQHVVLGALPFQSTLEEFKAQVCTFSLSPRTCVLSRRLCPALPCSAADPDPALGR